MARETLHIRNPHMPAGEFTGGIDEMNQILNPTLPGAVRDAGAAYAAAAHKFSATMEVLHHEARALAEHWGGEAAEKAVKQMERLYRSSEELSLRSKQTGSSLHEHGVKLEWYRTHQPGKGLVAGVSMEDGVAFAVGTVATGNPAGGLIAAGANRIISGGSEEDKAAQEHMRRLAGRTVEANDAIPATITTDLPDRRPELMRREKIVRPRVDSRIGPSDHDVPVPTDPFGAEKKDPLTTHRPDPFDTSTVGNDPTGTIGGARTGTDLAGLDSGPGLGANGGLGGNPGIGGAGLGGGGGSSLGGDPPGTGVGPGMGAGMGAAGRASGAGGKGGGGQPGLGGAPAGGGAKAGEEEERQRTTWLTEDEDIWGADGDAVPPVIG